MDRKTRSRLIAAARQISTYHKPRNDAKNARKVAPATFQCEQCQDYIYEGKQTLEYIVTLPAYLVVKKLIKMGERVRESKIAMDHKKPVMPIEGFASGLDPDWNIYFDNMFGKMSDYQCLCKECHTVKSVAENELRRQRRKKATNGTRKKKARKVS